MTADATRIEDLDSIRAVVEGVISELGLSAIENRIRTDDGHPAWGLMRGSAQVFIFIKPDKENEPYHSLQIIAPILRIPERGSNLLSLYRHLLSLNVQELSSVAFGIQDDTVVIIADRSTEDLDQSEIKDLVLRIGFYADLYDDALVTQFGGTRYSD